MRGVTLANVSRAVRLSMGGYSWDGHSCDEKPADGCMQTLEFHVALLLPGCEARTTLGGKMGLPQWIAGEMCIDKGLKNYWLGNV